MILTLDIGNTQIFGGVFDQDQLLLQFRKSTKFGSSSDEFGLFFRAVLKENQLDPTQIKRIALCSVVPDVVHSVRGACTKYFNIQPFILQAGAKTGLKIKYRNPLEVGSDRIANAIAATHLYPNKNLIIIDLGTAITVCAISSEKEYLGGLILPGLKISMEALESQTAKLPTVEIIVPENLIGKSTIESIQAGLYHGNLFALSGITHEIKNKYFKNLNTFLIGTGGFSRLYEKETFFDCLIPELVLIGLYKALQTNL